MFDVVNQHVTKILLAADDGDSIARIAEKIGTSYGWTHTWVTRLEDIGVVERDDGVHVVDRVFADRFEAVAKTALQRGIDREDVYLLPNFAGMPYAFTMTDAVFVWTKGGYHLGRNRDDYPVFVAVEDSDVAAWRQFFAEFGVETRVEERGGEGIYVVLFPRERVEAEWVENAAVIPLHEAVAWMRRYEANFEPALEMVDDMYGLDLGVAYRERSTV